MFRSLYAKLMCLFLAVMLSSMAVLTVLLYRRIRDDKIEARLDMLVTQAYDVAYLAARSDDPQVLAFLLRKAAQVMSEYDAYIVIFDHDGEVNPLPLLDETIEFAYDYTFGEFFALMVDILQGKEMRYRFTIPETGAPVFTVGVPCIEDGVVMGAVFIHTSGQSVEASYRDILHGVTQALVVALVLASILILIVCQLITRPLRAMAQAADRFARGDFQQRVHARSRDEVGRLAKSFNSMAADLERTEEMRRQFVANVSHELRSPLTSMQGFINGMLDGTIPGKDQKKYLGIVLDETKRLGKLIAALLDLSRIENGHTPLAMSKFDINEMIARVLIRQEARINGQNISVHVEFAEETAKVLADADRIEQVMINLIDNAVKYAGEGGVLTVSTRRDKEEIRVAVADNGPGMPKEDLPFIFDRFFIADKARTTGCGMGLGLSIIKSILDQHGADIDVVSEPGKGTRFEFALEGA